MLGDSIDREKDRGGLRSQEGSKDEKMEGERERQRLYVSMNNMVIRRETKYAKISIVFLDFSSDSIVF